MQYRLFNGVNRYWENGNPVPRLKYKGPIVVAIDPSKTNTAVVIGDPGGEVISIIEMSGNNWSVGPAMDTTVFCSELKEFLGATIDGYQVMAFGLEKAITKKGMEHHHSNMVLTEIRASILNLAWEKLRLKEKDVEVNNWSWKHYVLPEGYRGQFQKGSKTYYSKYLGDHRFDDYFGADVTDAMCIYEYLIRGMSGRYVIACTEVESPVCEYTYSILPGYVDSAVGRTFEVNPSFSLEQNATYYANRSNELGAGRINLKFLRLEDIYEKAAGFISIPAPDDVRLVVRRLYDSTANTA